MVTGMISMAERTRNSITLASNTIGKKRLKSVKSIPNIIMPKYDPLNIGCLTGIPGFRDKYMIPIQIPVDVAQTMVSSGFFAKNE